MPPKGSPFVKVEESECSDYELHDIVGSSQHDDNATANDMDIPTERLEDGVDDVATANQIAFSQRDSLPRRAKKRRNPTIHSDSESDDDGEESMDEEDAMDYGLNGMRFFRYLDQLRNSHGPFCASCMQVFYLKGYFPLEIRIILLTNTNSEETALESIISTNGVETPFDYADDQLYTLSNCANPRCKGTPVKSSPVPTSSKHPIDSALPEIVKTDEALQARVESASLLLEKIDEGALSGLCDQKLWKWELCAKCRKTFTSPKPFLQHTICTAHPRKSDAESLLRDSCTAIPILFSARLAELEESLRVLDISSSNSPTSSSPTNTLPNEVVPSSIRSSPSPPSSTVTLPTTVPQRTPPIHPFMRSFPEGDPQGVPLSSLGDFFSKLRSRLAAMHPNSVGFDLSRRGGWQDLAVCSACKLMFPPKSNDYTINNARLALRLVHLLSDIHLNKMYPPPCGEKAVLVPLADIKYASDLVEDIAYKLGIPPPRSTIDNKKELGARTLSGAGTSVAGDPDPAVVAILTSTDDVIYPFRIALPSGHSDGVEFTAEVEASINHLVLLFKSLHKSVVSNYLMTSGWELSSCDLCNKRFPTVAHVLEHLISRAHLQLVYPRGKGLAAPFVHKRDIQYLRLLIDDLTRLGHSNGIPVLAPPIRPPATPRVFKSKVHAQLAPPKKNSLPLYKEIGNSKRLSDGQMTKQLKSLFRLYTTCDTHKLSALCTPMLKYSPTTCPWCSSSLQTAVNLIGHTFSLAHSEALKNHGGCTQSDIEYWRLVLTKAQKDTTRDHASEEGVTDSQSSLIKTGQPPVSFPATVTPLQKEATPTERLLAATRAKAPLPSRGSVFDFTPPGASSIPDTQATANNTQPNATSEKQPVVPQALVPMSFAREKEDLHDAVDERDVDSFVKYLRDCWLRREMNQMKNSCQGLLTLKRCSICDVNYGTWSVSLAHILSRKHIDQMLLEGHKITRRDIQFWKELIAKTTLKKQNTANETKSNGV